MTDLRAYAVLFLIASSLLIFSCRSSISQIKDCFQNYKSAVVKLDGERAVSLVDSSTIASYSHTLTKANQLDSSSLEKESLTTKFTVLKIRFLIPKEDLRQMNGKKLLATLINHGVSGNGNIEKRTLGNIKIKNDSAEAQVLSNGEKSPFIYRFLKEGTSWKIRIVYSDPATDIVLKQLALDERMTENEYIFKLLEEVSGKKPTPDIWKPLN